MFNLRKLLTTSKSFLKKYYSTIYALSSGYGKCGVAVVRVSGPKTQFVMRTMLRIDPHENLPKPRTASLKKIYDPSSNATETIDRGLILWFPAPNSFTGEDSCEFQVHGSVAVIETLLRSLGGIDDVRLAEPGEFVRRAFHNGKLDLTEVEGLSDLINAETELQRKQAFLQMEGSLSKRYNSWRSTIVKLLAEIEAYIDFEETEALDNDLGAVVDGVERLRSEIDSHVSEGRRGEVLRSGVKTVIVGEPNVGKSSLLNNLCNKPRAIVSPIEGTTRDLLEITMNINGYPLLLTDTAGIRTSEDFVEIEGIRRAFETIRESDLLLFIVDARKYRNGFEIGEYLQDMNVSGDVLGGKEYLVVFNKVDLIGDDSGGIRGETERGVYISCKTKYGMDDLVAELTKRLEKLCGNPTKEHPSMNQERHRNHLSKSVRHLQNFIEKIDNKDVVIAANELHEAARQLGKLTGSITTEELLDTIFSNFCIGK